MRVLLIPSKNNYPHPEPDATSFGQGMPYRAAALTEAGHEVFGLNMNYVWCHGSAPLTLERMLRQAIAEYRPQLIGVSGLAPDYHFVRDTIFFARQIAPDVPIVIGGGLLTYDPDFIFPHLRPDFGIIGEGDFSIVQLVDHLDSGADITAVDNLIYWNSGKPARNPLKSPEDLDALPLPNYGPFDFEQYLSVDNQTNNFLAHTREHPRILPVTVGRSCPFKCTFCCHYKGATYRARSIDNVMAEVAHFYERYRFNILYIHDELLFINVDKGREFCEKVRAYKEQSGADFDWGCYMRLNDAEESLLREMKASGCRFIGYGLESASKIILKSMKKGTTPEMIRKGLAVTQKVGLGAHGNFIYGDIAETPQTIRTTIDFFRKHCRDLTVYSYHIVPYPGSELFQHCLDRGLICDRETYYRTVAHDKGGINMTGMDDETFYGLTAPVISDIFNARRATVESVAPTDEPTPDRDAPFELRRTVYRIRAVCPHCAEHTDYLYPLRIQPGVKLMPFIHSCTQCHKKLILDLSEHLAALPLSSDPAEAFYTDRPYVDFYPFDPASYSLPTAPTPQLIGSHKEFNLIRYGNEILALARSLGPLDVTALSDRDLRQLEKGGTCFVGQTIEGVKAMISR